MALEIERVRVRDLAPGEQTRVRDGLLSVDLGSVERAARAADPALTQVTAHLVHPGESTRIACVKDAIEPRTAPPDGRAGERRRVRTLAGTAVVTCGRIVGFQEGIVDMSGPAAAHSPFSSMPLVVLEAEVGPGCSPHAHETALRAAGLAAARHLAGQADGDRGEREVFDLASCPSELPRVAYVYMLLSQGLLHDTWVEGRNAQEGLPRRVDPGLALEGGIVSGNCVSACDKNTTWHHQNNAVLLELLRRHGRDLALAGCVLTNEPVRLAEKTASAEATVELVGGLQVSGAVISKEGFGNPDADLMMIVRGLESIGVNTVAITDEFAGQDGASQSLADSTPEANAVISVGNANERISLPPMERTLGSVAGVPQLAGAWLDSMRADGSIDVELQAIVGSTNQLGQGRLTARDD